MLRITGYAFSRTTRRKSGPFRGSKNLRIWLLLAGSTGRAFRSAALRLIKVESDINGILPAGGGPLPFISFLS